MDKSNFLRNSSEASKCIQGKVNVAQKKDILGLFSFFLSFYASLRRSWNVNIKAYLARKNVPCQHQLLCLTNIVVTRSIGGGAANQLAE